MKAYDGLQGMILFGRKFDVHYSLPRPEDDVLGPCNRDKNQGTLVISIENAKILVNNDELERDFSKFGDIRDVRDFRNYPNKKFIEFYDSRACVAAHDAMKGSEYHGGVMDARFAWDYPRR